MLQTGSLGRNPTAMPTSIITISVITFWTMSAAVRPNRTAEREIGSERKRSTTPVATIRVEPDAGHQRAEHRRLDDDARHQEVDVIDVAGVDRAAEDEAEQQHEHHRLDEGEDDVDRLAQGLAQLPRGHHAAVGEDLGERQPGRFGGDHAAFFPVSVRKTSSRLGCCSSMAAIGSALASSRRTASAEALGSVIGEADLARGGVDDRLVGEIGEHARPRPPSGSGRRAPRAPRRRRSP